MITSPNASRKLIGHGVLLVGGLLTGSVAATFAVLIAAATG